MISYIKERLRVCLIGLLCAACLAPLCPRGIAVAYAAGPTLSGLEDGTEAIVFDLQAADGYTVTPQKENGAAVSQRQVEVGGAQKAAYANVARFKLQFTGAADQQYVVTLVQGDTLDVSKLKYIDQKRVSTSASFDIYPSALTQSGKYSIFVTTGNGEKKVAATFEYLVTTADITATVTSCGFKVFLFLPHPSRISRME